ncbi:hypothetical protein F5X68DRAFT_208808 [Plectosphaerella plurivora]|uniref:Secreted protein n=1 Tax=Plectosphaerella plurivora TaxID=936078 RepID=A0A9P8VA87_9PEZI|nr:hypothetical protein F5X68DRAFT_208808 [Plectosphaerella plurivora]
MMMMLFFMSMLVMLVCRCDDDDGAVNAQSSRRDKKQRTRKLDSNNSCQLQLGGKRAPQLRPAEGAGCPPFLYPSSHCPSKIDTNMQDQDRIAHRPSTPFVSFSIEK